MNPRKKGLKYTPTETAALIGLADGVQPATIYGDSFMRRGLVDEMKGLYILTNLGREEVERLGKNYQKPQVGRPRTGTALPEVQHGTETSAYVPHRVGPGGT